MFHFSGAHGTTEKCAVSIQRGGFSAPSADDYTRMFGCGLYMFSNDTFGWLFAWLWAENKVFRSDSLDDKAAVLFVDIKCPDDDVMVWSRQEENDFNKWFRKNKALIQKQEVVDQLNRVVLNKYRLQFVRRAAQKAGKTPKAIVSGMPLSPNINKLCAPGTRKKSTIRYRGIVIKDMSIVPAPPYDQIINSGEAI